MQIRLIKMKNLVNLFLAVVFSFSFMIGGNIVQAQDKIDAELLTVMNNFAEQDIADEVDFTDKEKFLLTLAVLSAAGGIDDIPAYADKALGSGVSAEEIKETVFQCTPYIGYAKAKPALAAVEQALIKAGKNQALNTGAVKNRADRLQQGLNKQYEIFGRENIDAMRQNTPAEKQFITKFLAANCFGDYYTRPVLDVKQRELITFVSITALGGCESQVKAHIQANYNVGNSKKNLLDALIIALPYIGYPRTLNALGCIE